jgi:vitamin B12 transporter
VAPVLVEAVAPGYPPSELGSGAEPTVTLKLTLDTRGNVTAVEVVEGAGPAFDAAAQEAALRSRFSPARRDGEPVRAIILHRVELRAPPASAAPALTGIELPASRLTPAPAARPGAAPATSGDADVTVVGDSRADRHRKSAEAVTVVELSEAKHESADLGQVLARTEGVGVRRSGGLGSSTRLSLNGLVDDQIRFFLDGIPLDFQGYTYGVGSVPVNLIERVDVYAGVVPVRYGADALGGAVDLRTNPAVRGTRASGSYEVGSFGTLRLTASGRHLFESSGFFASVNGFLDNARNDYHVDDVLVASPDGSERTVRAKRFHDRYRAGGGNVELGWVNRPWARRLLVRAHYTGFDQDVQNNPAMTIPYGGITYAERATGASLRYEQAFGKRVSLRAVTGYASQRGHFVDEDTCVWSWLGQCTSRTPPGETDIVPHDQVTVDDSVYGRYDLSVGLAEGHALRATFAPTYFTRTGDERYDQANEADKLNSVRTLFGVVSGAEYEVDVLDGRLENIAFGKVYFQRARSDQVVAGGRLDRADSRFRGGLGNAARFRFSKLFYAKASYELATRLPSPEESFGDNVFIKEQEDELLRPETSHNVNVSLVLETPASGLGKFRSAVSGFARSIEDLIVRIGFERGTTYQNVAEVRSLGVEAALDWTSPGDYLALRGNVTYMDFTNLSETGPFRDYRGDRIPNRPYLMANASVRLALGDLFSKRDELWLSSHTGYVQSFWLGWESVGSAESRLTVPSQLVETLALGYLRRIAQATVTGSVEAQNLTDARVYDYFGSQRPGRAFYLKSTIEY